MSGTGDARFARMRHGLIGRLMRRPVGALSVAMMVAVGVTAVLAPVIATSNPMQAVDRELLPPSWAHLMGTNGYGRDLFSSVVYGVRTSAGVVVWVTLLSSTIGIAVGCLAGYRGGVLDDVLMRVAELFQVVPRFLLALIVLAMVGPNLRNLIVLLGVTSWPMLARVVRAETLRLRTQEFVSVAEASGAGSLAILRRHIVPNVMPAATVVIALTASRVILIEASLRFLGLGDPNTISLGSLARDGQGFLEIAWWMAIFPGGAIAFAAVALNLFSDALNDVLNPHRAARAAAWRRGNASAPVDVSTRVKV